VGNGDAVVICRAPEAESMAKADIAFALASIYMTDPLRRTKDARLRIFAHKMTI